MITLVAVGYNGITKALPLEKDCTLFLARDVSLGIIDPQPAMPSVTDFLPL